MSENLRLESIKLFRRKEINKKKHYENLINIKNNKITKLEELKEK